MAKWRVRALSAEAKGPIEIASVSSKETSAAGGAAHTLAVRIRDIYGGSKECKKGKGGRGVRRSKEHRR